MKKAVLLFTIFTLLLTCTSCIGKKIEKNENMTMNEDFYYQEENSYSDNSISCMSFVKAGDFSEGVAWVKYADENYNYYIALIDTAGKILYSQDWEKHRDIPGKMLGLSAIKSDDKIVLIDKKGNIITDSIKADFDKFLAYGDGYALVYKYEGPKNAKHIYKVIDNKGNTINQLELDNEYLAAYKNCDVFSISIDSTYGQYCLFNAINGKTIYLSASPEFYNNVAYIKNAKLLERDEYGYDEAGSISFCAIDTNFEIKNSNLEWTASSGSFIYTMYPASIIDFNSGKKYVLEGYENIPIKSIEVLNNYGCVKFIESGDYFFTLINNKAEEQLEPICYRDIVVLSEDKIAYKDPKTKDFVIIDYNGNILAENLDYKTIGEFSNGIALAVKDDHYYYINSSGEFVFESIHY